LGLTEDEARYLSAIWCSLWSRKRPSLKFLDSSWQQPAATVGALPLDEMAAALLQFPLLTHHIDDEALLPTIFKITKISKIFKQTFQPTAREHLFSLAGRTRSCNPFVAILPYTEVTVWELIGSNSFDTVIKLSSNRLSLGISRLKNCYIFLLSLVLRG
jgi:hypothetical protein